MQIINRSILLLIPFIFTTLESRENPFIPTEASAKKKVTSNIYKTLPNFETTSLKLDDSARVLKEVTFVIQNLDGSISEHQISVEKTIDQHQNLTISQSYKKDNRSSFVKLGDIEAITKDKNLFIRSKEPFIRQFSLSDPEQIIIDFKNNTTFAPIERSINISPFKNISLKKHKEFARLTITLDGKYLCAIEQKDGLINLECR